MGSKWAADRSRKRRAIRAGVVAMDGITKDRVYERDNGICFICENWVAKSDATLDHIFPISKGGPHTMGNIAIAHENCNRVKADKSLLELDAKGIRNKLRRGLLT